MLLVRELLVRTNDEEPFLDQFRNRVEDRDEPRRGEEDVVVALLALVSGNDGTAHLTPLSGVCLDVWIS